MPNPNPYKARQAKRPVPPKVALTTGGHAYGTLEEVLAIVWGALKEAEGVLTRAPFSDNELKLKSVHAVSQCAGQYAKLLEASELEARLSALEAKMPAVLALPTRRRV